MYGEQQRYADGGTSWGGYLAATGRRDRQAEREELSEVRRAAFFANFPDCQYWHERFTQAADDVSAALSDADWDAWMDHYPAGWFEARSWMVLALAYEQVLGHLRELPAGSSPETDELIRWFGEPAPMAVAA